MTFQLSRPVGEALAFSTPKKQNGERLNLHADEALDVITQLKSNLTQLEDLHGRLRFMMIEVEGLIRKKL